MANSIIKGENCILEFYDGAVWKKIGCARSVTFTAKTEFIEKTVTTGGKFKFITPTVNSFELSFDGVCALGDSGFLNIYNLRQLQYAHQLIKAKYTRTAMNGTDIYIDELDFFIESSEDTGSFDGISTFSIKGVGTGTPTQTIIDPPPTTPTVKRIDFTAAGGETSFTSILLINKDILGVHKDGIGNARIITSGTPVSKEVKYTTGTGQLTWAMAFETDENAYVYYQDL